MKKVVFLLFTLIGIAAKSQTDFSVAEYQKFLISNQNLEPATLINQSLPEIAFCNDIIGAPDLLTFDYVDSVYIKLGLTENEKELLTQNQFVVTERLSYTNFGDAFQSVFAKDLPVFLSTDAILHALHMSYDKILKNIEGYFMVPNLEESLEKMYSYYNTILDKYKNDISLNIPLEDADLYITVALSLLKDEIQDANYVSQEKVSEIINAIYNESYLSIKLFSERLREIDFSQYKPRGHYVYDEYDEMDVNLEPYFRCMMWLGRMELYLTPPPENPWEEPWKPEEIQRMIISSIIINEIATSSGAIEIINENEKIINYLVGQSDNMTPQQLESVITNFNLTSPADIYNTEIYETFENHLQSTDEYQQKILSSILYVDPFSSEPDIYPVTYKLMGQRFIIDSYILGNVIYDKIIFNGVKIMRLMPDPLDALYVLGNNNGALIMADEIEEYKYSPNLNALRYLVDSYDEEFWEESLYNIWLSSIRELNPSNDTTGLPFFMLTNAWQHEKLNTQLASWAQLRHDNLLYAKQSYTPAISCSYPHSYIEPYPEFYAKISNFANEAYNFFNDYSNEITFTSKIKSYFLTLDTLCYKLSTLAQKELTGSRFSKDEIDFLKNMLYMNDYPSPVYTGWYTYLFYGFDDANTTDYIIADVHTQPTDEFGAIIGKVLHGGTGKINLGVFLCPSPSNDFKYTAFVGPVMSYYQQITDNFQRLTDEEWKNDVENNNLPDRPDWVNIYLADDSGNKHEPGIELPGEAYTFKYAVANDIVSLPVTTTQNLIVSIFPNPLNDNSVIKLTNYNTTKINIALYNINAQKIANIYDGIKENGTHYLYFNTSELQRGVYFIYINTNEETDIIKVIK